jgi:hypothetical protein
MPLAHQGNPLGHVSLHGQRPAPCARANRDLLGKSILGRQREQSLCAYQDLVRLTAELMKANRQL